MNSGISRGVRLSALLCKNHGFVSPEFMVGQLLIQWNTLRYSTLCGLNLIATL